MMNCFQMVSANAEQILNLTVDMTKTVCIHVDLAWQSRHCVGLSEVHDIDL